MTHTDCTVYTSRDSTWSTVLDWTAKNQPVAMGTGVRAATSSPTWKTLWHCSLGQGVSWICKWCTLCAWTEASRTMMNPAGTTGNCTQGLWSSANKSPNLFASRTDEAKKFSDCWCQLPGKKSWIALWSSSLSITNCKLHSRHTNVSHDSCSSHVM